MVSPTNTPPQVNADPLTTFGHWWWRRWARPRNPVRSGLAGAFWFLASVVAVPWNRVVAYDEDHPNPDPGDQLTLLLTWFALSALANGFASCAYATCGQAVEFGGRRKDTFLMLTIASFCVLVVMFFSILTNVA